MKGLASGICIAALLAALFSGCTRIVKKPPPSSPTSPASVTSPVASPSTTAAAPSPSTTSPPATGTSAPRSIYPPLPATAQAKTVPAQYQALYQQLSGYLDIADKIVSDQWYGSPYPVGYAAELLTADTNAGPGILEASARQWMLDELDGHKLMGCKAVTVEIGYPVFDPQFYIFIGQTPEQAQQTVQTWLDYYKTLVREIHSRGMKMIVEANPLLAYYIPAQSTFNPGGYYKTLSLAAYQQGRSQHNIIVARDIGPDYLILQSEPQTDAVNDFRPELNDPTRDVAMVRQFVSDLESAGITGLHHLMLLGTGAGTWQPNWQSYFSGFAAIPALDMIDCHIYNLQPDVNQYGEFAIAIKVADIAHAAGKGVSLCEFWFSKSVLAVGLTDHGDPLSDTMVRDVFSFWTPLDAKFLNAVVKLANSKHFDYISGFGLYNWFALTDYDTVLLPPDYPPKNATENAASDAMIKSMQFQLARQALANRQLSPTGQAYQAIISGGPKP